MIRPVVAIAFATLAACTPEKAERPPYYWKLVSIDGQPFPATARLAFTGENTDRLIGDAPCNSFTADVVKGPFPTLRIANIVATERACDDLVAEQAFFEVLSQARSEGVGIGMLYFTTDNGRRLDFKPEADLNPALNAP